MEKIFPRYINKSIILKKIKKIVSNKHNEIFLNDFRYNFFINKTRNILTMINIEINFTLGPSSLNNVIFPS